VAFIASVPAQALTRRAGPRLAGLLVGLGAIAVVGLTWEAGLWRDTSATS
jgi:ABC-type uncharacterized transport system permease subunit